MEIYYARVELEKRVIAEVIEKLVSDTGIKKLEDLIEHLLDYGDEEIIINELRQGEYFIGT
ncbi:TPA: hypothetical protein R1902_000192 [Staphylococcus delphini]|uniref:hypothetical protein n=1 Tax=Staphylococcus sp. MI 10-1553 TaxID=1912064 RepID=UPI0013982C30|nr:hypothetical protein [Staphylococcus sp. MI 10-1553]EGQ3664551.1 hypothetical protein [Staphylococcus pseudintermedius]HEC2144728.1 hypothetical protein [Staphylococcus delphini]EMC0274970.1 hypothetical protein [Staphylococcus pseudintermedius]EMC0283578.1 hypothetical protein [Staphylococcus pseudintermedius]QHW38080.1 hypothetical protein GZH82_12395 [Staphylococcus sp. MI 10-1553]